MRGLNGLTKAERAARERTFPRCADAHCNNVAGRDQTLCGAHRRVQEEKLAQRDAREAAGDLLDEAETVEDLRDWLRSRVLPELNP